MKILEVSPPLVELPFLNAGKGSGGFYRDRLPVHQAIVDALPPGVAAIVATSDLQGRELINKKAGTPPRLLGECLPAILVERILPELGVPEKGDVGVLLAGDFYTVPALDRRGGSGDVTDVWFAFADRFAWAAGVAGNHDTFGTSLTPISTLRNMHFLDGDCATLSQLKVGGIGGIIGDPHKPQRRTEDDYLDVLMSLLELNCDVVIMHDGPDAPSIRGRGSSRVRELIELARQTLIVRGHSHWEPPLGELAGGTQVLNVDARVVVLRRA